MRCLWAALTLRTVEQCQQFLHRLTRACAVFVSWADELEENSVSLSDEISKDKDRYREQISLRCVFAMLPLMLPLLLYCYFVVVLLCNLCHYY